MNEFDQTTDQPNEEEFDADALARMAGDGCPNDGLTQHERGALDA